MNVVRHPRARTPDERKCQARRRRARERYAARQEFLYGLFSTIRRAITTPHRWLDEDTANDNVGPVGGKRR